MYLVSSVLYLLGIFSLPCVSALLSCVLAHREIILFFFYDTCWIDMHDGMNFMSCDSKD